MGEDGKCIWWIGSWCILCCVMSLGYWKLRSFKYVLLGKWLWRFSLETDNFWKWLLVVKYGEKEEERALNYVCYLHRVGVWKGIRESWETFSRYITFITGDGRKVQFWFDGLCMDQALIDIFKELFQIAVHTMAMVCDYMEITFPCGGEGMLKIGVLLLWDQCRIGFVIC